MLVEVGDLAFEWVEPWAAGGDLGFGEGWAHPGMSAFGGRIYTFHERVPHVLVHAPDGALLDSFEIPVREGHGISVTEGEAGPELWVADPGIKANPDENYQYGRAPGRVIACALDGTVLRELERPPVPVYEQRGYRPTSIVVNERRFGGDGAIWVADGYGQSLVHRYRADGGYVATIDGSTGAGAFACPHGLFIDRRRSEPELYIADRTNQRVQVYGLEGGFRRSYGEGFLNSPSGFAALDGGFLVVAELRARLALVDGDDQLVGYIGENADAPGRPGWPNDVGEDGIVRRTADLVPGKFNSPHGITSDESGVYVSEWLVGGRTIKLGRVKSEE